MSQPAGFWPTDFSPGDRGKTGPDWSQLELHRILSAEHPLFSVAYGLLWEQFGAASEMEERGVIAHRLQHRGEEHGVGAGLNSGQAGDRTFYEMDLVLAEGQPAAVRDHTVILPGGRGPFAAIVHLSHNLVLPAWRRSGLAAWMRALPVLAARECLGQVLKTDQAASVPEGPIVLAAEMEPLDASDPARMIRLKAYEAAGFRKVNPAQLTFYQPDFRPAAEIQADRVRPLPLHLIVRWCGCEDATTLTGAQALAIVEALYGMYRRELPPAEVAVARAAIAPLADDACLHLWRPTEEG